MELVPCSAAIAVALYDYTVVGDGSAGVVVAHHLTKQECK
jgi:hypothetical protein